MTTDPLSHQLQFKDLGPRGLEIELTVINQGEAAVALREAWITVRCAGIDKGSHRVSFQQAGPDLEVSVPARGSVVGRCQLPPPGPIADLQCRLHMDARASDEPQTRRISRRVKPGKPAPAT